MRRLKTNIILNLDSNSHRILNVVFFVCLFVCVCVCVCVCDFPVSEF
jgi:hypothetical protein